MMISEINNRAIDKSTIIMPFKKPQIKLAEEKYLRDIIIKVPVHQSIRVKIEVKKGGHEVH